MTEHTLLAEQDNALSALCGEGAGLAHLSLSPPLAHLPTFGLAIPAQGQPE